MRCVICDKSHKFIKFNKRHQDYLCSECRVAIFQSKKTSYVRMDTVGDATNIYDLLTELEERMPGLFYGSECPEDGFCNCTYKSGCLALKKDLACSEPDVSPEYVGLSDTDKYDQSNCQSTVREVSR